MKIMPSLRLASRIDTYAKKDILSCAIMSASNGMVKIDIRAASTEKWKTHLAASIRSGLITNLCSRSHNPIISAKAKNMIHIMMLISKLMLNMVFSLFHIALAHLEIEETLGGSGKEPSE